MIMWDGILRTRRGRHSSTCSPAGSPAHPPPPQGETGEPRPETSPRMGISAPAGAGGTADRIQPGAERHLRTCGGGGHDPHVATVDQWASPHRRGRGETAVQLLGNDPGAFRILRTCGDRLRELFPMRAGSPADAGQQPGGCGRSRRSRAATATECRRRWRIAAPAPVASTVRCRPGSSRTWAATAFGARPRRRHVQLGSDLEQPHRPGTALDQPLGGHRGLGTAPSPRRSPARADARSCPRAEQPRRPGIAPPPKRASRSTSRSGPPSGDRPGSRSRRHSGRRSSPAVRGSPASCRP